MFRGKKGIRDPEAESRTPVMVAGDLIIHAEAFRTFAHEASGRAGQDIRDMLVQDGQRSLKEAACKGKAVFRHGILGILATLLKKRPETGLTYTNTVLLQQERNSRIFRAMTSSSSGSRPLTPIPATRTPSASTRGTPPCMAVMPGSMK
jgi:hypothetical protein